MSDTSSKSDIKYFMNWQYLIVGIIILLATFYVCKKAFVRVKSFSPKSSPCKTDCGCGNKN
ncbi:MAG: hypothetical protein WKF90_00960 [Pyrinomonadaceae bacterium]